MKRINLLFLIIACICTGLQAQDDRIKLSNGSFEDMPRHSQPPMGWYNCGMEGESPPDVQPGAFEVRLRAQDGMTYLGMVTRDNETWEAVGQRLSTPLEGGNCYQFRIYLTYSDEYFSISRTTLKNEFFVKPVTLRIWAGNGYCDKRELLASSDVVSNTTWEEHTFKLKPKRDYKYIVLEAFYKTPTLFPYNGNLLVDNASDIIKLDRCSDPIDDQKFDNPEDQPIAKVEDTPKKPKDNQPKDDNPIVNVSPPPPAPKDTDGDGLLDINDKCPDVPGLKRLNGCPDEERKIIDDLDIAKVKEGQKIKIEKLNFIVDDYKIIESMHPVLDEIYSFMTENPKVIVEIGGHTNRLPSHEYCNWLSKNRASAVTNYLINKGLNEERISFKGYGKTQPVDMSNTAAGRKKNQRVEIKILSLKG